MRSRTAGASSYGVDDIMSVAKGSDIVWEVGEKYFDWLKEDDILLKAKLGIPIENRPDISEEKARKDCERAEELLSMLARVDCSELSHDESISLGVLETELRNRREQFRHYWLSFPITPYSSPFTTVVDVLQRFELKDRVSADRYLRLLAELTSLVDDIVVKLRGQLERGIIIPRPELDSVIPFVRSHIGDIDNGSLSLTKNRCRSLPDNEIDSVRERASALLETEVNPAIRMLAETLEEDYRDAAPVSVGFDQYPGGQEYYGWLIMKYTSLEMSPSDIHELGLKEVDRMRASIDALAKSLGFEGSFEEFRRSLVGDPRFVPSNPEAIGEYYMRCIRRIEPMMDEYFTRLPKAGYSVKRLPVAVEGALTFGYYQEPTAVDPTGYYIYNGSNHAEQSLLTAADTIFHELLPGHHMEACLAREDQALPQLQRHRYDDSYSEGWAEYAASLAIEMGAYPGQYDLLGRLLGELFMSARLVVDTGMNAMGWSLERAESYMRENSMLSEQEIRSEALRYSCDMPAQALSYRLGHLKIRALRDEASRIMGDDFDIRRFHDVVLLSGAIPLSVLEGHIKHFINEKRRKGAKAIIH